MHCEHTEIGTKTNTMPNEIQFTLYPMAMAGYKP